MFMLRAKLSLAHERVDGTLRDRKRTPNPQKLRSLNSHKTAPIKNKFLKVVLIAVTTLTTMLLSAIDKEVVGVQSVPFAAISLGAEAVTFCMTSRGFPLTQIPRSAVIYMNATRPDLTINHSLAFDTFVFDESVFDIDISSGQLQEQIREVDLPAQRRLPFETTITEYTDSSWMCSSGTGSPYLNDTMLQSRSSATSNLSFEEVNSIIGLARQKCDFIVGGGNSRSVVVMSRYLAHVPVLDYGASSNGLSDAELHPLFVRSVPPDVATVTFMADFMKVMGWAGCYSVTDVSNPAATCWEDVPSSSPPAATTLAPIIFVTTGDAYGLSVRSDMQRLLTTDYLSSTSNGDRGGTARWKSWEVPTFADVIIDSSNEERAIEGIKNIPNILKEYPYSKLIFLGFNFPGSSGTKTVDVFTKAKIYETHIVVGLESACLYPIPGLICPRSTYDDIAFKPYMKDPLHGINGELVKVVPDYPTGIQKPPYKYSFPYAPGIYPLFAYMLDIVGIAMNATQEIAKEYLGCPVDPITGLITTDSDRCTQAILDSAFNNPTDAGQIIAFGSQSASLLPRYAATKFHNSSAMEKIMKVLRGGTLQNPISIKPTMMNGSVSTTKQALKLVNGNPAASTFNIIQVSTTVTLPTRIILAPDLLPPFVDTMESNQSRMILMALGNLRNIQASLVLLGTNVSTLLNSDVNSTPSSSSDVLVNLFSIGRVPIPKTEDVPFDPLFAVLVVLGTTLLLVLLVACIMLVCYLHYSDPNLHAMKVSGTAAIVVVRVDELEALWKHLPRETASSLLRYTTVVRHLIQIYHGYELESNQTEKFRILFGDPEDALMFSYALQEALVDRVASQSQKQSQVRAKAFALDSGGVFLDAHDLDNRFGGYASVVHIPTLLGEDALHQIKEQATAHAIEEAKSVNEKATNTTNTSISSTSRNVPQRKQDHPKHNDVALPTEMVLKQHLKLSIAVRDTSKRTFLKGDEAVQHLLKAANEAHKALSANKKTGKKNVKLWTMEVKTAVNHFYKNKNTLSAGAVGPTSVEQASDSGTGSDGASSCSTDDTWTTKHKHSLVGSSGGGDGGAPGTSNTASSINKSKDTSDSESTTTTSSDGVIEQDQNAGLEGGVFDDDSSSGDENNSWISSSSSASSSEDIASPHPLASREKAAIFANSGDGTPPPQHSPSMHAVPPVGRADAIRRVAARCRAHTTIPRIKKRIPSKNIIFSVGDENIPRRYDQLWNGPRVSCLIHAGPVRVAQAEDPMHTYTYTGQSLSQADTLSATLEGGQVGVTTEFRDFLEKQVLDSSWTTRVVSRGRYVSKTFAAKNLFKTIYSAAAEVFYSKLAVDQTPPCHSGKHACVTTKKHTPESGYISCIKVVETESYPAWDYPISSPLHPSTSHASSGASAFNRNINLAGSGSDLSYSSQSLVLSDSKRTFDRWVPDTVTQDLNSSIGVKLELLEYDINPLQYDLRDEVQGYTLKTSKGIKLSLMGESNGMISADEVALSIQFSLKALQQNEQAAAAAASSAKTDKKTPQPMSSARCTAALQYRQQVADVVRWSPLTVGSAAIYTGVVANTGDFVVLNTHFLHSPLKQRRFNNMTQEHVIPTSFFEKVRLKAISAARQKFRHSKEYNQIIHHGRGVGFKTKHNATVSFEASIPPPYKVSVAEHNVLVAPSRRHQLPLSPTTNAPRTNNTTAAAVPPTTNNMDNTSIKNTRQGRREGVTSNPTSEDGDGETDSGDEDYNGDETSLEEHLQAEYHFFKEASRVGCDEHPGDHRGEYILKRQHVASPPATTTASSSIV